MKDMMDPLRQFSPFGGRLVAEAVPGAVPGLPNPENEVQAGAGADRTMYAYVPASGCPHGKQTPVLMVLRDDAGRDSAQHLLTSLGLDALAEARHLVVLFPDPEPGGWNHGCDPLREDDADFLVRCFAALGSSRGGVTGFNGMMFHLACSPAASALVMRLAARSPVDAAGVMVGALPAGCALSGEAPQVAWLYERDAALETHLARVNRSAEPMRLAASVEARDTPRDSPDNGADPSASPHASVEARDMARGVSDNGAHSASPHRSDERRDMPRDVSDEGADPSESPHASVATRDIAREPTDAAARWACVSRSSPAVRHVVGDGGLTAHEVALAWDELFSNTRRWRDDTHGTYRPRIPFARRGFVAHVDERLGGQVHTWFEYAPPQVRDAAGPVPLVLYLHGGNCVGLYGAEQSGWADLADRDGFVVAFPDATCEERWNVWDDPRLPSDAAFVLALIERLRATHPIDPTRIYLSGFSMGSMFASALACSCPDVVAGAVALNGPHLGYLRPLDESLPMMRALRRTSVLDDLPAADDTASPTRAAADSAKAATDYRMPFVQVVGLADPLGFPAGRCWPARPDEDDLWTPTVDYWRRHNAVPEGDLHDPGTHSGFASDRTTAHDRFVHQSWSSADAPDDLLHLVSVRRLAHAVDPRAVDLGWRIVRRFARQPDGALSRVADAAGPDPAVRTDPDIGRMT